MNIELRQVIGKFQEPASGKVRRVGWDMDFLIMDGRAIATINRVPGAPIGLYPGVMLTPAEKTAVENAIAKARGGKKPAKIGTPVEVPYELLDDEDELVIPARLDIRDGADDE